MTEDDAGAYACVAENLASSITSEETTLIVLTKPTILMESELVQLDENETLEIVCAASGTPIPDVHWTQAPTELNRINHSIC